MCGKAPLFQFSLPTFKAAAPLISILKMDAAAQPPEKNNLLFGKAELFRTSGGGAAKITK
jgi:hypothetical protein